MRRRIQVEVSFPEGDVAKHYQPVQPPNIGFFGLTTLEEFIGVAMDYQVSQKLHAGSDPDAEDYESQRIHDIFDLLLIKDAFYSGSPPASLRVACVDICDFRADEAAQLGRPVRRWPPVYVINEYWRFELPSLGRVPRHHAHCRRGGSNDQGGWPSQWGRSVLRVRLPFFPVRRRQQQLLSVQRLLLEVLPPPIAVGV